jgi:hypothetical protein
MPTAAIRRTESFRISPSSYCADGSRPVNTSGQPCPPKGQKPTRRNGAAAVRLARRRG